MVSFPNCKINLGLRVLRKRQDGYHDIETVFFPLPFYDVLELIPSHDSNNTFTVTGLPVDGNKEDNLCVKAYDLLKKDYKYLRFIQCHLHKQIPTRAGLGGGSADAAFMLQLLNKQFHLEISQPDLIHYALQLGSDCPFFTINKPCFATSRGEDLATVVLNLSGYTFILVNPGIAIPTGKAFSAIQPSIPAKSVRDIIQQPLTTWKKELINDFEPPVFAQHPAIGDIKEQLYQQGAIYASLSGSGSTVYGIFDKNSSPSFSFPENYFIKHLAGQL